MKSLRIATRKSPLALWQAQYVADRLLSEGISTELVPLVSGGDTDMRPIDGSRQIGVFTKRIQQALLDDQADVAVHSLKDLPTEVDSRLTVGAVPQREAIDDALVSGESWTLDRLPEASRVGTGSRRRAAQLLYRRPDLQILPIRGNVQTRLEKLREGEFDAIILAEAGIVRLEMHNLARVCLHRDVMLPAPGQGALGIEVRTDDDDAIDAVLRLDHVPSHAAVLAERRMLAALHGGCLAPIAALAEVSGGRMTLHGTVLSSDGRQRLDKQSSVAFDEADWRASAEALAAEVSEGLLGEGAAELIEQQR
jgi:hydroxymethylbilane synthase